MIVFLSLFQLFKLVSFYSKLPWSSSPSLDSNPVLVQFLLDFVETVKVEEDVDDFSSVVEALFDEAF